MDCKIKYFKVMCAYMGAHVCYSDYCTEKIDGRLLYN